MCTVYTGPFYVDPTSLLSKDNCSFVTVNTEKNEKGIHYNCMSVEYVVRRYISIN